MNGERFALVKPADGARCAVCNKLLVAPALVHTIDESDARGVKGRRGRSAGTLAASAP